MNRKKNIIFDFKNGSYFRSFFWCGMKRGCLISGAEESRTYIISSQDIKKIKR